ncbi:hypothetical protein ACU7FV_004940 [Escherichia coli]
MNNQNDYIEAAQQIIASLGLPRAQQNERSALCLLALLNLTPGKSMGQRGKSACGHYTNHELGSGALRQGLRTQYS